MLLKLKKKKRGQTIKYESVPQQQDNWSCGFWMLDTLRRADKWNSSMGKKLNKLYKECAANCVDFCFSSTSVHWCKGTLTC